MTVFTPHKKVQDFHDILRSGDVGRIQSSISQSDNLLGLVNTAGTDGTTALEVIAQSTKIGDNLSIALWSTLSPLATPKVITSAELTAIRLGGSLAAHLQQQQATHLDSSFNSHSSDGSRMSLEGSGLDESEDEAQQPMGP